MAQLGKFKSVVQTSSGDAKALVNIDLYREGATVNGAQGVTTGNPITVRNNGKIRGGDTAFIDTDTATTFTVDSVTDTTVTLSGFGGTLNVTDKQRIIPLNNRPEPFDNDQGGGTALTWPRQTDANGESEFFLIPTIYDEIQTGGTPAITPKLSLSRTVSSEFFAQIRVADQFDIGSSTGGIQEAMDDLPSVGGKVLITSKTYLPTVPISVPSFVTIQGMGPGKSIIKRNANTDSVFVNADQTNGNTDIEIRDLTIDGNSGSFTTGDGEGIEFDGGARIKIINVEIKNTIERAIELLTTNVAMTDVWIEDCNLHDLGTASSTRGHGIAAGGASALSRLKIANNTVRSTDATGSNAIGIQVVAVGGTKPNDIIISGNNIDTIEGHGIHVGCTRVVIANNSIKDVGQSNIANGGNGIFAPDCDDLIVVNNNVDGVPVNSDNGIEINDGLNTTGTTCVISGNRVSGILNVGKYGISLNSQDNSIVANNICRDGGGGGIKCTSTVATADNSLIVSKNICVDNTGPTTDGILVSGRDKITVNGNIVNNAGQHGINIREGLLIAGAESVDFAIIGNSVEDSGGDGISCRGDSADPLRRITISGNILRNNTTRGLVVSEAEEVIIADNVIRGNTGDGIAIGNTNQIVIEGNLIQANGEDGIIFTTAITDCLISGNMIIGHNTAGDFGVNGTGQTLTRVILTQGNFFQDNDSDTSANVGSKGPDIVAAGTITLPTSANYFDITGTATIATITASWAGRVVTFQTDGLPAFDENGNLSVAGTIISMGAGDVVSFICDGTNWKQHSPIMDDVP